MYYLLDSPRHSSPALLLWELDIFGDRSISVNTNVISFVQTMERLRSQDTGYFKKKPADLMQIFKVRLKFL